MNFFVKAFLEKLKSNPEEVGKMVGSVVEWYQDKHRQSEQSKRAVAETIEVQGKRITDLEARVSELEQIARKRG